MLHFRSWPSMMASIIIVGATLLLTSSSSSSSSSVIVNAQTATTNVWVDESKGNGVTYGGDVKLSMWSSVNTNNVHNVVNTMVQGLQMTLIRLPMVAQWDADDNRNYDIKDFAIKSKNQGMEVMLSIANTNGLFRSK